MGPRSADRGNVDRGYGHALNTKLQWGRDQLIAEIQYLHRDIDAVQSASMGPRSADRGNIKPLRCAPRSPLASIGPPPPHRGNTRDPRHLYPLPLPPTGPPSSH